jgi:hypothetical protein
VSECPFSSTWKGGPGSAIVRRGPGMAAQRQFNVGPGSANKQPFNSRPQSLTI